MLEVHPKIAVVIPCYRVCKQILKVIEGIGPEVKSIYIVDDGCPDNSGEFVKNSATDHRLIFLRHVENRGVGAAVMTGYRAALKDGFDILVKLDGDGQMDARLISELIEPIVEGQADYTKGNRFYNLEKIRKMPAIRLFGNTALSLLTKLSSGYWNLFDPTNGFTAIHAEVAKLLPMGKLNERYFFESDVLFRLNTLRAVVLDVAMDAQYNDETSHLKVSHALGEFLLKHSRNFVKRIFYNYYLRDLSLASLELPMGLILFTSGVIFGLVKWHESAVSGIATTAGTVMLAAMPILIGCQFLLAFIGYDISSVPKRPRQKPRPKTTALQLQHLPGPEKHKSNLWT